jgi:hypothetical protein
MSTATAPTSSPAPTAPNPGQPGQDTIQPQRIDPYACTECGAGGDQACARWCRSRFDDYEL